MGRRHSARRPDDLDAAARGMLAGRDADGEAARRAGGIMRSKLRVLTIAVLGVAVTACGGRHVYTPRFVRVERERIAALEVAEPIAIVNAQPSSEEQPLAAQEAHVFVADYRAWTDVAIEELRETLRSRGMPETTGATKRLEVAVTNVVAEVGFVDRCTPTLAVRTSDGLVVQVTDTAGSSRSIRAACEVALARAVAAAVTHEGFAAYLRVRTVTMAWGWPGPASNASDSSGRVP